MNKDNNTIKTPSTYVFAWSSQTQVLFQNAEIHFLSPTASKDFLSHLCGRGFCIIFLGFKEYFDKSHHTQTEVDRGTTICHVKVIQMC